jgi:copper chaperone CopZ
MYEIVYFNWSGTKEDMKKEKEIVERVLSKFDGVELVNVFIPSSEWKHAVLYKSKDFESFLRSQKEIRKELHKAGHKEMPRKLELLVDIDSLY